MVRKNKKKFPDGITAFGYVKEEDGAFTAICINLGLFVQDSNPSSAIDRMMELIREHVAYVKKHHGNDWEQYLYQPIPWEYVDEFESGLKKMIAILKNQKERGQQRRTARQLKWSPVSTPKLRTFAETLSPTYT